MNNKSQYNPEIHHRRSIRLKGYDYSQAGLYFITICCQNRACLFGEIVGASIVDAKNDDGVKNGATTRVARTRDAKNDDGVAMEGIPLNNGEFKMILNEAGEMIKKEWLKLAERFGDIKLHEYIVMPNHFHGILEIVGANDDGDNIVGSTLVVDPNGATTRVAPAVAPTVGNMMDAFKSITTVEYIRGVKTLGWKRFDGKLWQRNYYEHIIRNEQSYQNISDYIIDNPTKWGADKFYTK